MADRTSESTSCSSTGSPRADEALQADLPESDRPSQELCSAAVKGDTPELQRLLQEGKVKDVNWQRPGDGNSALHLAAEEGHTKAVTALVAAKADPELQNDFGLNAIALAEQGSEVYALLDALTTRPDDAFRRCAVAQTL
uniref:Uncharacterized protein n=1 Tax=Zooxanthella nutricula TaxID=1333877 RepID=A0A6V0FK50_9DINO|mmetsp:Transcript_9887/g.29332  ORF Transcript_9887/g.29332 Transcript_9887/m.29332 type:complete len:140 (+) Transcript_9887:3-422(+)